jgi:DNA-binding response OmpR family regulator
LQIGLGRSYDHSVGSRRAAAIRGMRILVVDDHIESARVTSIVLGYRGHACAAATTGRQPLLLVDTFEPEVILLEWKLHDGSGVGLAPQLRQRSELAGRRVLIIATSTQTEPLGFTADEQLDAYLTKPLTAAELEAMMEHLGVPRHGGARGEEVPSDS